MKIDNRILLPFAGPFVALGMIRALWWLAGASWENPALAAFMALFFGVFLGAVLAAILSEARIEIGHIKIGGKE